jgi:glycosyltransferase involved in cell wall biosynthesis
MKTLIISFYFPPCTDGAATLMHNLCKYIPKESYIVATASDELGKYVWDGIGAYDPKFKINCRAIRVPVKSNSIRNRIRFMLTTVVEGMLLSSRSRIDSILAVYPDEFDLFAAYLIHLLTRKPFALYMHDLYSEMRTSSRLYRMWRSFENRIFLAASTILVTNEKFRERYVGRGINNVTVFQSCVDLKIQNNIRPESPRSATKKLRIVYTGSVYGANEDAIVAFLKVARKLSDLEIVFSTPHKSDFLKDVSIGFLPKKECLDLQRSADVLLLPLSFKKSLAEEIKCAFPTKILEYMSAGKPILAIVPKGSFVEELIEKHDLGLVVTELSDSRIADAINALRSRGKRLHFSRNALKTVTLFDACNQADALRTIMERIVVDCS